jgi:hypothetical protein
MYDLIGDIHGHADALQKLRRELGYAKRKVSDFETSQACSEMRADSRAESGHRTTTHLKNNREHSAE